MEKSCDNCAYENDPCWDCMGSANGYPLWKPKKVSGMVKHCLSCIYGKTGAPLCSTCMSDFRNWQPKEAPMKTKIEILKPVTIASVAAENPCRSEFAIFNELYSRAGTYEIIEPIALHHLVPNFDRHPNWKPWLIEHGFIREVEEREKIGVGSLWRHGGYIYFLAQIGDRRLALINILDGNRKHDSGIDVGSIYDVTKKEWSRIKGSGDPVRVHGHLEFVEDN